MMPQDVEHDDDDHHADDFEEVDELEEALGECGLLPKEQGGGCQLAGTEHCDFDCPFRDDEEFQRALYDEEEE